jgi:hypothetical protein
LTLLLGVDGSMSMYVRSTEKKKKGALSRKQTETT